MTTQNVFRRAVRAGVSLRTLAAWDAISLALRDAIERDRPDAYALSAVVSEVTVAMFEFGLAGAGVQSLWNTFGPDFAGTPTWSVLNAAVAKFNETEPTYLAYRDSLRNCNE
ncbi:hypothetical protein [Paraburkholderia mimosarum]|uniref:hypothetical protein n=1 Tax=Paraburkholderia mimosarum TaxID=312026 RepID=UPI0004073F8C|nr:hypothetical protein [Paraburkholderia mimosarum]